MGMSDEIAAGEESVEDGEAEDVGPVQPDPDDQGTHLSPTRSTRNRPSALDLARALD
jgi:hypothetical protein